MTLPFRCSTQIASSSEVTGSGPSSDAMIEVIDPANERLFFSVAEAKEADMSRAVGAARKAFDEGPWPRLSHPQRAEYLRAIAAGLRERAEDLGQLWSRESGVLHAVARTSSAREAGAFEYYAGLADTFPFEERVKPTAGEFGLIVREPVGVVGAIIPWNAPWGSSLTRLPRPCWPGAL
jgi:aldehyde dehydrogenase (NAD+)